MLSPGVRLQASPARVPAIAVIARGWKFPARLSVLQETIHSFPAIAIVTETSPLDFAIPEFFQVEIKSLCALITSL